MFEFVRLLIMLMVCMLVRLYVMHAIYPIHVYLSSHSTPLLSFCLSLAFMFMSISVCLEPFYLVSS